MLTRLLFVALALLTVSFVVPTASAADICVIGGADNCVVRIVTCVQGPCPPCVLKFCPDPPPDPRDLVEPPPCMTPEDDCYH